MSLTINAEDIMPMVNMAWDKSFGCKDLVKKAVAMQGWNPLNRGLLLNPEIQKTQTPVPGAANSINRQGYDALAALQNAELPQVNTTDGFAGSVMDRLIQERLHQDGRERQNQMLQDGERIQEELAARR